MSICSNKTDLKSSYANISGFGYIQTSKISLNLSSGIGLLNPLHIFISTNWLKFMCILVLMQLDSTSAASLSS